MTFTEKIKSFFAREPAISQDFFDALSDLLVEGDIGAKEAFDVTGILQDKCKKDKITTPEEAKIKMAELLEGILLPTVPLTLSKDRLTIVLLLGVNGVGKTTTAAKFAHMFQNSGIGKPILAAADTFRAAAIDQLKIHAERVGLRIVAHQHGGDPAAVIYDAIEASGGEGLVIADTAGRMHTKSALVEELRKIDRVVESKAASANYIKYLVIDATTGRNALAQAEIFCEAVSPQAAILTKYDSTAKGGVVFSLASSLRLPVAYVCTGEKYDDIGVFDPHCFAREFAGIE
jgi:fused signal recognition particle receptor